MVKLWAFWIVFNLILFAIPQSMVEGTVLILAPLAGLFVYALVTKDVMQSLLLGTFSMYILWHKFGAVNGFFADLMTSLSDEENHVYVLFLMWRCDHCIKKKRKYQKLCEVYHIQIWKKRENDPSIIGYLCRCNVD